MFSLFLPPLLLLHLHHNSERESRVSDLWNNNSSSNILVKAIFKISTFAIISAYAIYKGSSSKELKE